MEEESSEDTAGGLTTMPSERSFGWKATRPHISPPPHSCANLGPWLLSLSKSEVQLRHAATQNQELKYRIPQPNCV